MSRRKASHASGSRTQLRRPRVLVVDDTPDNRDMYVEYLRYVGFDVTGESDGERAVAAARRLSPALVVMDLSLPGIDGCEAARRMKADLATRDLVIIAVSGHADAANRARALDAGCDLFIGKPCLPGELAAAIFRLLDETTAGKKSSAT